MIFLRLNKKEKQKKKVNNDLTSWNVELKIF